MRRAPCRKASGSGRPAHRAGQSTAQSGAARRWRRDRATSGRQIRTAALAALRTGHASPATIADTILRRPADVTACLVARYGPPGAEPPAPHDVDPGALLDGLRIDTRDLAARAVDDPFARAELHRLLTQG